jgi:hypothetical protein
MTASRPDPRHHAVEVIERGLVAMAGEPPAYLARALVTRLEAAGLVIRDAPPAALGTCDEHLLPHPCRGCAADAKAAPDTQETTP